MLKLNNIKSRVSPLWLLPIVTAIAAAILIYDTYKDRGPAIVIRFSEAPDVEPGKSNLRYRGISVGHIENVTFSETLDEVLVEARMTKAGANLAREGSKFILVQPQISFQGVQGLDAIVGGPYIRIEPGKGPLQKDFRGQLIGQDSSGKNEKVSYHVRSKELFSLNRGDPVTFRGMTVGSIGQVELSKDSRWLEIVVNIEKRYQHLVNNRTIFWRESGIQANLGLFSSKIDISSIEAMMKGALAFATPGGDGGVVRSDKVFDLHPQAPEGWRNWSPTLSNPQREAVSKK